MKILRYLPFLLSPLLLATACIEEDLDACPPEGGALEITLRAEKFRARPPYEPADVEEDFARRIRSLDYLLYADGRLVRTGSIADLQPADRGGYLFRSEALPFGTYRFAVAANGSERSMGGSTESPERRWFVYGADDGDYFRGDLLFEVTCPCRNAFETVLERVRGVVRFRFENLPDEIDAVEVSLDNLGERMPLAGDPQQAVTVTRRIAAADLRARTAGNYVLGTFPTLPGRKTAWRLRLFEAGASAPVYDRVVTDTLTVERNQLLELSTRFSDGGIDFTIRIDTSWDGSNDGGGEVVTGVSN